MKVRLKQLLCLCLATLLISSAAITAYASNSGKSAAVKYGKGASVTTTESVSFDKVTGKVDLSKVVIDNLSDSVLKADELPVATTKNESRTVIVTLDSPTLMDYADGTSVDAFIRTADGRNAISKIRRAQDKMLSELAEKGVSYTVVDRYDTVTNAVALKVNTSKLAAIKAVSSVATAVVSETYNAPEIITTSSSGGAVTNPSNVYKTGIYDTTGYDEYGYGMTVAVLDTGLDYTHDAFSDKYSASETRFGLVDSDVDEVLTTLSSYKMSEAKGETLATEDVFLSRKVPFAYDYADGDADVYPAYSQHGVHVAGIVAGESDSYYDKDGILVKDEHGNNDKFRGAAPKAQLVICKVFTDDLESKDIGGAVTEDIIAALDDCVKLGVDVINMSLGTSCGFSSLWIDGDDEGQQLYTIYQRIKNSGISLMCAASNDFSSGYGGAYGTNLKSNPDSATIGSPSTFDGAMSVASINGQEAPYMMIDDEAIFFEEASNANSVPYDFVDDMLAENEQSKTFKYVMVPGVGEAVDYTRTVAAELSDKSAGKTIAVVKRGKTNFQEKVEMAMQYADAVIIYNNVAGLIRMNLGDIVNPIPAVSVSIDAGEVLRKKANSKGVGYIEVNRAYTAGPFMNDYSSWGPTPDLKLKPDVTAHGGEILSAVSGGYQEMSGTSMATPNLAGLTALVRSYVIEKFNLDREANATAINTITNQLLMSTATTVYNEVNLPYSPRKQGAGLATVSNIFGTNALLYTDELNGGAEDNRPKAELGQDEEKNGVYTIKFAVNNFSADKELQFRTKTLFFTETVALGGLAVAEKAHMLDGAPAWKINGVAANEGDVVTVAPGSSVSLEVTLTLSKSEKEYIDKNFENGMFVEGFLKLVAVTSGQCDLTLPFMGFYGDYKAAPMLDYSCYEVAEFEKDTSLDDDEKPKASVWATQAYAMYYNEKYVVPMGQFVYLQNDRLDAKDKLFVNEDYASLSCYNEYYGEGNSQNYVTATGIKALYAGLLRNAELVTYSITDAETGELITERRKYRVGKAYSGGGRGIPAQVLMEERPEELGLVANGKYKIDFAFYSTVDEEDEPVTDENSFSMTFYLDYEAPILTDTRVRYYEYEESNRIKQRVYLDFDIYDNHYPQALLLCYADNNAQGEIELMLATEYVTPILTPNKNGTTTVSIEVTEFYEKYKDRLYLQIDDYALNHNIYKISFASSKITKLPDDFTIVTGSDSNGEIELGVNESLRLELDFEGEISLSSFIYNSSAKSIVSVKDGEIFGVRKGRAKITVANGKGLTRELWVNVVDKGTELNLPSIRFGVIENAQRSLVPATGAVEVAAGKTFTLDIVTDPWYYDKDKLTIAWSSTDNTVATVTQDGVVSTLEKRGTAVIKAVIMNGGRETLYSATVILNVAEPFTIENMTLTDYNGLGGHVVIPDDENVMYIGEEAFKDDTTITSVVIPKTVQNINERAFIGCTNLREVYFVSTERQEIADSDIALIYRYAFQGCTSLQKIDLSNVKVVTLDKYVFSDCTELTEIVDMHKIVKMDDMTFSGCTSLSSVDVSGVHTSGRYVFSGCTSLEKAVIGKDTVLGEGMFSGCTSLAYSNEQEKSKGVVINTSVIPANAFANCGNLKAITFADNLDDPIVIGNGAFSGCVSLESISFGTGNTVKSVGNRAFEKCSALTEVNYPNIPTFGSSVYEGSAVVGQATALYNGTVLVRAPKTLSADFEIKSGTTEIAPYAFEGTRFADGYELVLPATVVKLGEGAFRDSNLTEIVATTKLTEIPAYCFYGTKLTKLPAMDSPIIGAYAFANADLSQSELTGSDVMIIARSVGNSAFAGTKMKSVHLVANEIGNRVFENSDVEEIKLDAEKVGQYTFFGCDELTQASFFDAVGSYTFCTEMYGRTYRSALEAVQLHGEEVGDYAFYGCDKLDDVAMLNVTKLGYASFADCTSLESIDLSGVTHVGPYAFINVPLKPAQGKLALTSATTVGAYAFAQDGQNKSTITVLEAPAITNIGAYAFYNSKLTTVSLPATIKSVGEGAFAASKALTAFATADGSSFFAEDGVLYRAITDYASGKADRYELVAYPTARLATLVQENTRDHRIYTIKEGTVAIAAYAFGEITDNVITRVKFPYSVRTIGDAAFFDSGIGEYWFESINAPALLTKYRDNGVDGFYSLVNANFEKYIGEYVTDQNLIISTAAKSPLRLYHATNGVGYDNYAYGNFFGTAETIGVLMDDETREVKERIEGFAYTIEQINAMNSWEINDANVATVQAFSDEVKETHRLLKNIADPVQLEFLGNENVEKLTAVEKALKSVKSRFGIAVKVSSLKVAPDSAHKKEYKVGEKFDMSGLKLIIEYDDYSTEYADMSKITLSEESDHALNEFDLDVKVVGYGNFVRIEITVTPVTDDEKGGFNAAWIYVPAICVVVLGGGAAAFFIIRKKRKGVAPDGDNDTSEPTDEPAENKADEKVAENTEKPETKTEEGKED